MKPNWFILAITAICDEQQLDNLFKRKSMSFQCAQLFLKGQVNQKKAAELAP